MRDLAARTLDATIPSAGAVAELSDDELIERLTKVRGIGPWTVHMLMIFYLGRPDVMPAGDFGIRKAFSLLYRRGRSVKPEAILRHSKRWQPHRSAASWYLWRSLDPVLPWEERSPSRANPKKFPKRDTHTDVTYASRFAIVPYRHRAAKNLPLRCLRSFQTNCQAVYPVGLQGLDMEEVRLQDQKKNPQRKPEGAISLAIR